MLANGQNIMTNQTMRMACCKCIPGAPGWVDHPAEAQPDHHEEPADDQNQASAFLTLTTPVRL